jgi:protein-S-isoprenylcysteine O-methyltransferase Ste14
MTTSYPVLIPALWALWLVYWIVAAVGAKESRRIESVGSRLSHTVPLILGGALIGSPHILGGHLNQRFVPDTPTWNWAGTMLVAFGLAFAVVARIWLGRNWSSMVELKKDHELIRSGPYRWVRHPIYTGLLTALLGTVLAVGNWRAVLGLALIVVAVIRKLTLEERFMAEHFGDAYARYRAEVPALLPYLF